MNRLLGKCENNLTFETNVKILNDTLLVEQFSLWAKEKYTGWFSSAADKGMHAQLKLLHHLIANALITLIHSDACQLTY